MSTSKQGRYDGEGISEQTRQAIGELERATLKDIKDLQEQIEKLDNELLEWKQRNANIEELLGES